MRKLGIDRVFSRALVGLPLLCLGVVLGAVGPVPAAVAAPAALRPVRVVPLDGAAVEATFVGIGTEGLRVEGRAEPFPLDAVREVRFSPDAPLPPLPEGATGLRVFLRGGDMVRGTLVEGTADGLKIQPAGLSPVKISFDAIRRIQAESASPGPCDQVARRHPPRENMDVAYTKSGDAYPGTLAGADATGITLENGGEKRTVRWKDLVVMHVDEPLLACPTGLVAEVETAGGSKFLASPITADAAGLTFALRMGPEITIPRDSLTLVRFRGGRFVYASDLAFESEFTPYRGDLEDEYLKRWYAARADLTQDGCPLRIGATSYAHGFAVHAKSVVKLPLRKAFTRFESKFGIDDAGLSTSEGPKGDVTARVLADGKEIWTSGGSIKGGMPAKTVGPLDVTGVDVLVLEVDFGEEQNQNDNADWADPILVRAP